MTDEYESLKRKRAYVVMDLVTLRAMLRLPPGMYIEEVLRDDDDRWTGCVKLVLCGESLPDGTETLNVPTRAKLVWVDTGEKIADVEAQVEIASLQESHQPKPPPLG